MNANLSAARPRIAVLLSGRGSNLAALLRNDCGGDIVVVGSNRAEATGLDIARDADITTFSISHKNFATREAFDQALVDALNEHRVDLVVLAGFMRFLTPLFTNAFAGRLINIHPSFLPSFPGVTKCTVQPCSFTPSVKARSCVWTPGKLGSKEG